MNIKRLLYIYLINSNKLKYNSNKLEYNSTTMDQTLSSKTMHHLCMSYKTYIKIRKQLSDNYSNNIFDTLLREKLINFIRLHPDHELKRQVEARDTTTNISHKDIHNSKIADLTEQASKKQEERDNYKKIWDSEKEARLIKHTIKMKKEKEEAIINRALKIEKARAINISNVEHQKAERENIRLARTEKKKKL